MARTITVKGIGKVTAKPDLVVLNLTLDSRNIIYDKAMAKASERIQKLSEALYRIGFAEGSIKTSDFNVRSINKQVRDSNGNYKSKFDGYEVTHSLKIQFDMDMKLLSSVLATISSCEADPRLAISFTVKDKDAINEEMLRQAATNAKSKAAILCSASGVKMGELVSIDYNWSEIDIYSNTRYDGFEVKMCCSESEASIDIDPEDITVSDTATFVWEIQ